MYEYALQVEGVTKTFRRRTVVDDVSFSVGPGEVLNLAEHEADDSFRRHHRPSAALTVPRIFDAVAGPGMFMTSVGAWLTIIACFITGYFVTTTTAVLLVAVAPSNREASWVGGLVPLLGSVSNSRELQIVAPHNPHIDLLDIRPRRLARICIEVLRKLGDHLVH